MKRGTPDHPKTLALMQHLQVSRVTAVGILEVLWHFTADYAKGGDIGRYSDEQIAKGLGWEGPGAELVAALVAARWLECDRSHRLLVHDWPEHTDDAVHRWLARSHERFADGTTPRLSRLNQKERSEIEEWFRAHPGRTTRAYRAPKVRTPGALPEPRPAPPRPAPPEPRQSQGGAGGGDGAESPDEPLAQARGSERPTGPGTATARELATLQADVVLSDIGHHWCRCFRRPAASLGVLRAARKALAGGYEPDALKLVIRVGSAARASPERFPERGTFRWAVEHGKIMDPSYILRPDTLDKLISEAEEWDRA